MSPKYDTPALVGLWLMVLLMIGAGLACTGPGQTLEDRVLAKVTEEPDPIKRTQDGDDDDDDDYCHIRRCDLGLGSTPGFISDVKGNRECRMDAEFAICFDTP